MKEIFEQNYNEERLPKLPKNICPECKRTMTEMSREYKCFSCGIGVEK